MPKSRNYTVGYGKPPKHTQFKPGQSGNPNGRPKGSRNLKTDLDDELSRQILIREDGSEQRVSKQRALVMALCNKAMKGDPRAIRILVELILRFEESKAVDALEAALSAEDEKIIENFETRLRDKSRQE